MCRHNTFLVCDKFRGKKKRDFNGNCNLELQNKNHPTFKAPEVRYGE